MTAPNCHSCDAFLDACPGVGADAICAEGRQAAIDQCASYVAGECLLAADGVCIGKTRHCGYLAKIVKVK